MLLRNNLLESRLSAEHRQRLWRRCIVVFVMLCSASTASSQVSIRCADTTFTQVGETASVDCMLQRLSQNVTADTLNFDLYVSNPTVLYPQRLVTTTSGADIQAEVSRLNDSVFHCRAVIVTKDSLTALHILAESLAGNDSICILQFRDIVFNSTPLTSVSCLVLSRSIGTPLPYIRFATMALPRPNPCEGCSAIHFVYRIDRASPVHFDFFDGRGKLIRGVHRDALAGTNTFDLQPDYTFDAGWYLVRMTTNSGSISQSFVIVN